MKKILILILSSVFGLAQAQKVNGELVDAFTDEKVPYANIYSKEQATIGSTADGDGKFSFRIPEKYNEKEFVFSAIGYRDTIIRLKSEDKDLKIRLTPIMYELAETTVTANVTYEKIQYGSADYPIQVNKKGKTTGKFLEKKTPFGFLVKASSRSVLRKFSYFIADEGKLGSTFVMKIVGFDKTKKFKQELMIKFTDSHSYDISHKPIVFTAEKRGWNTIELPKDDWIILPKGISLCVIYQLDKGNDLVWENDSKTYNFYGSVIANYDMPFSRTKLENCSVVKYGSPYDFFAYHWGNASPAVILECDKLK